MKRGRFITFEGGEGAGKSTQAGLLVAALQAQGITVLRTREPGGSPGAEAIRDLLVSGDPDRWTPTTEALLHYAQRADHVARAIEPALASGQWVVCDRFMDSTMAYQGYGHRLGRAPILALQKFVLGALKPDLTLILDLAVDAGLARATARGGADRYERMPRDFHARLRAGFRDIARREPRRCVIIPASGTIEATRARIARAVAAKLGIKRA